MRLNNYMKQVNKKLKKVKKVEKEVPNGAIAPSPPPSPSNNKSVIDNLMQSLIEKHSQNYQSKKEKEEINNILLDMQPKKLIDSQEDIEQIKNFLTEYMNCFILFGYDATKNRVYIRYAANQNDEDALIEALRKIVMNYI